MSKAQFMLRRALLVTCFVLSSVSLTRAQNSYAPTVPDNTLTPADPIGIPPQASATGTHEAINNTNGGISLFIPVLSLPQRGGWNLTLGYFHSGPAWSVQQDVQVMVQNPAGGLRNGPATDYYTYHDNLRKYSPNTLQINLPSLQASIEYTGDTQIVMNGSTYNQEATFCVTNWVFTDWSGNKHPFTNRTVCNIQGGAAPGETGQAMLLAQVTDSSDGSWLRLDTSNMSDLTVRTKDGTLYHFPGFQNPYPSCFPYCLVQNNSEFFYRNMFSNMVDTNGNTVSNNNGGLTDTIGRKISASNGSISYTDSNGKTQTISLTKTTASTTQNYDFGKFSCVPGAQILNHITVYTGPSTFNLAPYTYDLVFPASDSTGTSRTYHLQFDGLGRINQISYPSGGYTKYDYQNTNFDNETPVVACIQPVQQISHKRECPLSSGSCSGSQELVTTYVPVPYSGPGPYNGAMDITDPTGTRTHVTTNNFALDIIAARETDRSVYDPGGKLLRTVHTDYTPAVCGVDVQLPSAITTTLNDVSPPLSSVEKFQYNTITMTELSTPDCLGQFQAFIDNATETDEYDYGATNPTKKTAQTWMTSANGTIYDIAGGHILDRLATRNITDPVTAIQSTLSYGYNTVGGITSKSVGGTSVTTQTTNYQRDNYGNITQMTDPRQSVTKFGYADSWKDATCAPSSNSSVYLTSVTDALNHVSNFQYYSCTGIKASATDLNGLKTSFTVDALGRMVSTTRPDGGQTTNSYVDALPNSVTQTTQITTGLSRISKTVLDGFARTTQTQVSDPQGTVYTDTTYDALGRVYTVSNPYRTGADPTTSLGTTTYFYDALGRKCLEVPPDGTLPTGGVCPATQPANDLFTTYSGNTTTVTDQTNKSRKSVTDGLGRLTQVFEDPAGLNYETDYAYDTLGNILTVNQKGGTTDTTKWRTRSFTYDSLSRLLTSNNPEVGTITYKYDSDTNCISPNSFLGLLVSKTDARGIRTCAQYDAINREVVRNYSNGDPVVTTTYDQAACLGLSTCQNIGHRTSVTDAAGSEIWSYQVDATNHRSVHVNQRTTNSSPSNITKTSTYYLDLAGNVTQAVYPTGRTVNYSYDSANRPITAADGSNGITYATDFQTAPSGCLANAVCYTPQGTFYALSIGQSASFTGLNLTHSYNSRLQPNQFKASSTGGNAIDITYGFVDPSTSKNAGHVYGMTNNLDSTRSQQFTYDQLNRITTAQTTSTYTSSPAHCWGESFGVDPWGNLQSIAATTNTSYTGCSQESGFSKPADVNNHLSGFSYDLSGNTTNDGVNSYVWDGESQLKSAGGVTYAYDGNGRRVSKVGSKLYWYGSGGDILAETDASGNTTAEYIFFGGKRIAMLPGNAVQNGGFQQGLQGWTQWGTAMTAQLITTPASCHSGNNCVRLSSSTGGDAGITNSQKVNVTNGQTITMGGWRYLESGIHSYSRWAAGVYALNGDSNGAITYILPPNDFTLGQWVYQTGSYTVPSWALCPCYALLYIDFNTSPTNGLTPPGPETNTARFDGGFISLGTSRVITTNTGVVCYDADFYPYGGERSYTNACPQNYKFEGKERDAETGNDDFGARYYSNRFGRWLSADWSAVPVPIPYADLTNPQTLNLYSMVADDPESFADLDGHDGVPLPAGKCGLLCRLKFILFGDPHNTRTAPDNHDPIGPVLVNSVVGVVNMADRAACSLSSSCTSARQEPYYAPNTPEQAKQMNQVEWAILFIPGLDVDALAADLVRGAKPVAEGRELQGIIDQLYKATDTVPGGTAGAVRAERTGIKVGGKIHWTKAAERARQLGKLIASGKLSGNDLALAKAIVRDLTNSLAGK
jgi:RHS repeat-associated protein